MPRTSTDSPSRWRRFASGAASGFIDDWLVPTVAYAVFWWFIVRPDGLRFTVVPYFFWQLLPVEAMRDHPWSSLLYLHAQPPLYNLSFAAILRLGAVTSLDTQAWASLLMGAISWLSLVAWHAVARRVLHSRRLAGLLVILLASHPGFALFEFNFFYPQMVLLELGVLVLAFIRYARAPSTGRLLGVMAVLIVIVYTRSLWHPLFGVVVAGLAGIDVFARTRSVKGALLHAGAGLALLLALVAPWSIKNQILFNVGGFSSWLGFNVRNHAIGPNDLWTFSDTGRYDAKAVRDFYSDKQWARLQSQPAVTILHKKLGLTPEGNPGLNMNHYAVPALDRIALRQTIEGYRLHPFEYLHAVASNFFMAELPAYFQIFSYNPETSTYLLNPETAYSYWHDNLYYGAWLIPLTRFHFGWGWWGFNLFAAFWLPLALIAGLIRLKKIGSADGLIWAMLVAIDLWSWLMIVLVDGSEGARMRWEVEPVLLLLIIQALREIIARFQRKSAADGRNLSATSPPVR